METKGKRYEIRATLTSAPCGKPVQEATWRKRAGQGPWDNEPDRAEGKDEATGLPYLALRSPLGNWCGYVGVEEGHPLFGHSYFDLEVPVHGGLTFSGSRNSETTTASLWWFGFDCAHAWDLVPALMRQGQHVLLTPDAGYKDLSFVRDQCAVLAAYLNDRKLCTNLLTEEDEPYEPEE